MYILGAMTLPFFWAFYTHHTYPAYRFLSQTISELGHESSPIRWQIAWGYFFPVAILIAAQLLTLLTNDSLPRLLIVCLAMTPLAYLIAILFPCDQGAPLIGSFKNSVHMLFGFFEYAGAIAAMIWLAYLADNAASHLLFASLTMVLVAGLALLTWPAASRIKGLIQRIMELSIFVSILLLASRAD